MSVTLDKMLKNMDRGIGERPQAQSLFNQGPKGTNYCLLIGIDQYEHAHLVPTLQHAVEDVTMFKKLIETKFTGRMAEGNSMNRWEITYLTDETEEKPTYDNIINFFEKTKSFGEEDNLIIYISGHGESSQNAINDFQSFMIPYDGNPNKLRQTCLRWDDLLKDYIVGSDCCHVLFIVDTCFCGVLHNLIKTITQVNLTQKSTPPKGYDYYSLKSRWLLTSTGSSEKVPDSSVFAEGLCAALRNTSDPSVSVQGLYNGIIERVNFRKAQQESDRSMSKLLPLPELRPFGDTTMHAGGQFVFYQPIEDFQDVFQSSLKRAFFDIDFKEQKRAFVKEDLQTSKMVLTVLNGAENAGHSLLVKALMSMKNEIFSNSPRKIVELNGDPMSDIITRLEYPDLDALTDAVQQTLKDSCYVLFVVIPSNDKVLLTEMTSFYAFWQTLTNKLGQKINLIDDPHSFFLFLLNHNIAVSEFDQTLFASHVNSKAIVTKRIKVLEKTDLEDWCDDKGERIHLSKLKELKLGYYSNDAEIYIRDAIEKICEELEMPNYFAFKLLEYKF